ncbi:MAG TPA: hypothetical protein VHR66_09165 [Gemmataceae bacterium]|jgi:hypothetical protein|nr:hypothetical protein [Gemmataceae bacterium]
MAASTWPGIRPGAQRFDVYNEGLIVYLFDESSLEHLKNSGADFQGGFVDEEKKVDKSLRQLARDGWYVAYELFQDDEVAVEVVVGPPLTRKELAVARWLKPQRAFLKLPSGKLRVDTPNTLPIHEEEQEDEPGVAIVPAGDYVLTLYRMDWNEMQNDGLVADGRPWPGPQEVIVLTPADQAKPPQNKSRLRFPKPDEAVWQGRYEISGDTFHGLAMTQYWWDNINVNVDRSAEDRLGLRPGTVYRVAAGDHVFEVMHFGDADMEIMTSLEFVTWAKSLAGERKEFGVSFRFRGYPQFDHYLTFPRLVSKKKFSIHARWLPAELTLLPDRHEIPPSFAGGRIDAD